ncbi:DUF2510 domain-containing protein [Cryobacterium sp. TMT1-2-2]|nr:DUF2510 domain-containing protein [Cryobacterium sp. TMT1-2-2]
MSGSASTATSATVGLTQSTIEASGNPTNWGSHQIASMRRVAHAGWMTASPNNPSAGWYPDPRGDEAERYWDGANWTAYARPAGSSAAPVGLAQSPILPAVTLPSVRTGPGCLALTVWIIVGAAVIAIVIAFATALSSPDSTSSRSADTRAIPAEPPAPAPALRATYFVEGTASSASITASSGTGTEQHDVKLPMTNTDGEIGVSHTTAPGAFLYISAQNRGDRGTVTCKIIVDGVTVSENTSSGAYGIASCDYSMPR